MDTASAPRISIIAAIGKNRELGKNNELIWRIPDDLRRVKDLTTGHPIIMGRKTYESIGRPLPNRTTIVITSTHTVIEGCLVCDSLTKAIAIARTVGTDEIFIFGGARVYAEALPITDRLYLTLVDATDESADAHFPEYPTFTRVVSEEKHPEHTPPYSFVVLEK